MIIKIKFKEDIISIFSQRFWYFLTENLFLEQKDILETLKIIGTSAYFFKNSACQNLLFKLMENLIRNFGNHSLFKNYLDFSKEYSFKKEKESESERFFFLESVIQSLEFFLKKSFNNITLLRLFFFIAMNLIKISF